MLKNYLTTAFRNFWKQKGYTFINIAGLSVGLACSIVILLWVKDELSYDGFHENGSRLYRIMEDQYYADGQTLTVAATPGPLRDALLEEVPEITHAARMSWKGSELFFYDGKTFKEEGAYADPELFTLFSFPVLEGNKQTALNEPTSIIISEKLARKYFGSTKEALGKTFRIDNSRDHTVTGVFKDIPHNSSLKFEYIMPVKGYVERNDWLKSWGSNGILTFVMLHPDASPDKVHAKIKNLIKKHNKESKTELFIQPYTEMYLHSDFRQGKRGGGRIEYVRLFSVVAVFILVIACINFMNLSTARAGIRAKEVGVRKAIGADRKSLIWQFIGESVTLALLAMVLAIGLVELALPAFNELTSKQMSITYSNPLYLLAAFLLAGFTGILAGSYPALFLSSFEAAKVLKGTIKTNAAAILLRKGLVVFQFSLSVMLIISTIIVYNQITYIKNKNLGYQKENLLYMPVMGDIMKKYDVFKQEVLEEPGILNIATSSQTLGQAGSNTSGLEWEGKEPQEEVLFTHYLVNYEFLKTAGIEMKEGRDFSREFSTDTSSIIINEEAAKRMRLKNPVGTRVKFGDEQATIIGVAKDFHSNSLHIPIEPAFIIVRPQNSHTIMVRIASGKADQALRHLEQVHQKHNPAYPFEYHFMDETFDRLYKGETVIGKLANYFAFVAVFISCLGLFGLAAFTAEQRTKEIGIRKVLGASVSNITLLLSKDFLKLVFIAILIATPLAWYAMHQWLQDFAYQVNIGIGVFILAGLAALSIALLTVSYQSIKAALSNPIKSLRSE